MARRERRLNEKTDFMHLCCLSNKDLCEEQPWKSNPFHEMGRNRRLRDTRDWTQEIGVLKIRSLEYDKIFLKRNRSVESQRKKNKNHQWHDINC
jgi:hypothetical protein